MLTCFKQELEHYLFKPDKTQMFLENHILDILLRKHSKNNGAEWIKKK